MAAFSVRRSPTPILRILSGDHSPLASDGVKRSTYRAFERPLPDVINLLLHGAERGTPPAAATRSCWVTSRSARRARVSANMTHCSVSAPVQSRVNSIISSKLKPDGSTPRRARRTLKIASRSSSCGRSMKKTNSAKTPDCWRPILPERGSRVIDLRCRHGGKAWKLTTPAAFVEPDFQNSSAYPR
jgi:hypothetical protein